MKKKKMVVFVLTLLLVLIFVQPAYANFSQHHWNGTHGTGAVAMEKDCPIVVEREHLIFDVQEFPEQHYENAESFLAYTGKVTAEYAFRNPADHAVTATLVFPLGQLPQYGENIYDRTTEQPVNVSDTEKYGGTVNGKPVNATIRHTLKARNAAFSLDEDLPKLADGCLSDRFFTPDLPVWVQQYSVDGIDKNYDEVAAAFTINGDRLKTRVLCEQQSGGTTLQNGFQVSCWVKNGDIITVYIFGELPKEGINWVFYENGACEKMIDGAVSLKCFEMTFQDYAMRDYDENAGILAHDWYNAQVELLRYGSETWGNGLIHIEDGEFSLMRWYEYLLTLEPGQRIRNTVTAPLYPAIDAANTPSIYAYTYLLSPAKTWAQFRELDIVINTPYYMTECGIDGFVKTGSGYALTLPGLPEGELTFALSESESRQPLQWSILVGIILVLSVGAGVLAIGGGLVFLLIRRKRRKKT